MTNIGLAVAGAVGPVLPLPVVSITSGSLGLVPYHYRDNIPLLRVTYVIAN